ncbi:MAG: methyl-accepting chemotaxis protein [Pirellulales bacterium]
MQTPLFGIRRRLVLLGLVPAALILGTLAWFTAGQVRALVIESAGEVLAARAEAIAARIEQSTIAATTAARTLAMAMESLPVDDTAAAERISREMVVGQPAFLAAAVILEASGAGEGAGGEPTGARWVRSPVDDIRIDREPVVASTESPLATCRQRFLDHGRADKTIVAEPRPVDGRMVVQHVHPIVRGGQFAGAAWIDRSLVEIRAELHRLQDEQAGAVAAADIVLISRAGRLLATTADLEGVDGAVIDDTVYGALLKRISGDQAQEKYAVTADPFGGGRCVAAAARAETAGWTVLTVNPERNVLAVTRGAVIRLALVSALLLGGLLALLWWLATRFTQRIERATAIARRVAAGDLTGRLDTRGGDESGQLLRDIGRMTGSLRSLVGEVKLAGNELDATARSLSAAGDRQELALQSLGSSTSQAAVASRQIAVTGTELLGTMNEVATVAAETAQVASAGRTDLAGIGDSMARLEQSTADFTERLAVIRQRAEDINMVITTITKVADQTNLLSINAAIEAEKAGEYGQGFIVVAREIRRLADQTAVATLDIERLVAQMHEAVSAGVGEMDRFATEVKTGVERVSGISGQFVEVIDKVHGLSTRFEYVNQGMHAQATGAQQITEALLTLTDGTRSAADTLREFQEAAGRMVHAVEGLTGAVSRFQVDIDPTAGAEPFMVGPARE